MWSLIHLLFCFCSHYIVVFSIKLVVVFLQTEVDKDDHGGRTATAEEGNGDNEDKDSEEI